MGRRIVLSLILLISFFIAAAYGEESVGKFQSPSVGGAGYDASLKSKTDRTIEIIVTSPAVDKGEVLAAIGLDDVAGMVDLLDRGASVNASYTASGHTSLMLAESAAMMRLLHDHGADVNATTTDGASVMHYAVVKQQSATLVPLLISWGAPIDVCADGRNGETPFFTAMTAITEKGIVKSDENMLRTLVKGGADVDAPTAEGVTPLMLAAMNDNYDAARLLIDLGASTGVKSKAGKTAAQYASLLGYTELARMLSQY